MPTPPTLPTLPTLPTQPTQPAQSTPPEAPEQKKTFVQWLEEQLNNVGNGVQVEDKQIPATDFKPRLDLIQSLTMPLEKRCKVCGAPISAGEYCDKCGRQRARNSYV